MGEEKPKEKKQEPLSFKIAESVSASAPKRSKPTEPENK